MTAFSNFYICGIFSATSIGTFFDALINSRAFLWVSFRTNNFLKKPIGRSLDYLINSKINFFTIVSFGIYIFEKRLQSQFHPLLKGKLPETLQRFDWVILHLKPRGLLTKLLIVGFYLISRASFTSFERALSHLIVDRALSSFYDWIILFLQYFWLHFLAPLSLYLPTN